MDLSKLDLPPDVRPTIGETGIPLCRSICPRWSPCALSRQNAGGVCKPAVEAMAQELAEFYRHDLDWRAAQAVEKWNKRHPTGQAVSYQSASGRMTTTTHGPAYLEHGRTAVVPLEEPGMQVGNSGVHLPRVMELDRLTPEGA